MNGLILSLFPGIGLLDMAFEEAGFCVVRGPDYLWGGDVRKFHPPAGRFDGIIGGPPCQEFSVLSHMVRHNGLKPKFGNLIPDFERCVDEANPTWFLMENVPQAPIPAVENYGVHSFILNNRQLGEEQSRTRRISFGFKNGRRVLGVDTVVFENPVFEYAALGGGQGRGIVVRKGGSGKDKSTLRTNQRLNSAVGFNVKSKDSFARLCRLQGLPEGFDIPPFKVEDKCKAVGNGVPLAMGRALAKAVIAAINER